MIEIHDDFGNTDNCLNLVHCAQHVWEEVDINSNCVWHLCCVGETRSVNLDSERYMHFVDLLRIADHVCLLNHTALTEQCQQIWLQAEIHNKTMNSCYS